MREPDTKRVLLDAAAEEFAVHGLAGARMRAIVARAGINERMIYHHFESKVGLYEAVLADQFRAPPFTPPATTGDAGEDFLALLGAFIRAIFNRRLFLALALHEAMTGWEHVPRASVSDIPAVLRTSFERARLKGFIRAGCTFEVMYLAAVGAAISGYLVAPRFTDLRSKKARDALVPEIIELVARGVTR